ncbi:hypothetical protein CDIK_3954 [Cucumispora dikerogammari]|nr:hypothetical protein CDIK_3954 [Cucumispora dikerogammari]
MFEKEKNKTDGRVWRCKALKCLKKEVFIRYGSILHDVKISLERVLKILYEWSVQIPIYRIRAQLRVDYSGVRRVFDIDHRALLNIENKKIEGPDCIVEVSETAVTKRKYNTGRSVRTVWCVGGVCRQHKTFFSN